jgi:hypothetical protein
MIRMLEILPQESNLGIMRGGSKVVADRPYPGDTDSFGLVLRFERRRAGKLSVHAPAIEQAKDDADDFARYEQEQDERINYRHRMLMNVIALVVVTLLLGAGVWIADIITEMEKDQDCLMQGRSNCAPIELPTPTRQ